MFSAVAKNAARVALGKKGGEATAKKLTHQQRRESARNCSSGALEEGKDKMNKAGLTLLIFCGMAMAVAQSQDRKAAPKAKPVASAKTAEPEVVDLTSPKKPSSPGPFGFEAGMTKEAVVAKLGAKALVRVDGDVVSFNTAPSPHPDFNEYLLMFSPRAGLVKLLATSRLIETSESGEQLKEKYMKLLAALKTKYGTSPVEGDLLEAGSTWTEPQYWMMGLLKKERTLEAIWGAEQLQSATALPAHLKSVMIDVTATSLEKGFISISYEFEGFHDYLTERNSKRDSVF